MSTNPWHHTYFFKGIGRTFGYFISAFIALSVIFLSFANHPVHAQCIDISDTPMDIKVQAAPPNINVLSWITRGAWTGSS